jgi:hypothetical protein
MLAVIAQTKFGKLYDCQVDLYADECPHCGHDTTSNPLWAAAIETGRALELDLIFQCQNNACQHLFIANYETIPRRLLSVISGSEKLAHRSFARRR